MGIFVKHKILDFIEIWMYIRIEKHHLKKWKNFMNQNIYNI